MTFAAERRRQRPHSESSTPRFERWKQYVPGAARAPWKRQPRPEAVLGRSFFHLIILTCNTCLSRAYGAANDVVSFGGENKSMRHRLLMTDEPRHYVALSGRIAWHRGLPIRNTADPHKMRGLVVVSF